MIRHAFDPPFDTSPLRLHQELAHARAEIARLAGELARERSAREAAPGGDLVRICVAALHLHGSLEPARVLAALREITAEMLNARGHALVETGPGGTAAVAAAAGVDPAEFAAVATHPAVRAALAGRWHLPADGAAPTDDAAEPCACVPLLLDGRVAGALALFGLPTRTVTAGDRRLLEMLSTTVPLALRAARLHAAAGTPDLPVPGAR